MAERNDDVLELELKLKYSDYEEQLARVDADTQKVLRQLRADLKSDNLKFDIEIAGAQAAGDTVRAFQLQVEKLTHSYKAQEAVVSGLTKQREKLQAAGKDTSSVQALIDKETLKLNKLRVEMNKMNAGFGDKILDSLGKISPGFEKATSAAKAFKEAITGINLASPLGITASTVTLLAGAVTAITGAGQAIDSMAKKAAEAAAPVDNLAERFSLTFADAELLHGVFAIDGTNAEVFSKAVQKLNKELASNPAGPAAEAMKRYGVELRNVDGTQKTFLEQTEELAKTYKRAKAAGEELDFVTRALGSGGNQFVTLLNGWDDYVKKVKESNTELKLNYALLHAMEDQRKANAESQRKLDVAQGQTYAPAALVGLKEEKALLDERLELWKKNEDQLTSYGAQLANVSRLSARLKNTGTSMFDGLKQAAAQSVAGWTLLVDKLFDTNFYKDSVADFQKTIDDAQHARPKTTTPLEDTTKEDEAKTKKRIDAYKKLNRELEEIGKTSHERDLLRLRDEVEANIEAGVEELDAWRLYYAKKIELEEKAQSEAGEKEQQRLKKEQDALEKAMQERNKAELAISEVFMSESEKRIVAIEKERQAWIKAGADELAATKAAQEQIRQLKESEAEKALREQKDLARFIANEQSKGNENWREAAAEYSRRQYYKSMGATPQDVQNIAQIGPDVLAQIAASAKQEALAPITNNITVNFDNAIVEDVSTQDKLANDVAGKILDALQSTMRQSGYNYGGGYR